MTLRAPLRHTKAWRASLTGGTRKRTVVILPHSLLFNTTYPSFTAVLHGDLGVALAPERLVLRVKATQDLLRRLLLGGHLLGILLGRLKEILAAHLVNLGHNVAQGLHSLRDGRRVLGRHIE